MKVLSIALNHGPSSVNALNCRRNAAEPIVLPEWRFGVSAGPETSPALYAIERSGGNAVTVVAQFRRTEPGPSKVQVRAIDAAVPDPGSGITEAARTAIRRHGGSVLGEVEARDVTFHASGTTGPVPFTLVDSRLDSIGVGAHDVSWRWQTRPAANETWVDITTTHHRIYTILDLPSSPWVQQPFTASNTQLPWIDVVDRACRWAAGATTQEEAAQLVTEAVFDLGPELIEYGCPIQAAPQYSYPYFYCTEFLELLEGETGRGRYVNCSDCATVVSTFSNVLGCDLWQSTMSGSAPFDLNPTIAIGTDEWRTACNWGNFVFHEVAWSGAAVAGDGLYDACLLLDADADPVGSPHTPLLPVNMKFGAVDEGLYRDRLAAPAGRANCRPQPSTRQRRPVV